MIPLAAVVVACDRQGRTLVGTRKKELSFLGGFTVFPGGSIQARDREIAALLGRGDEAGAFAVGALRELMEEAGLFYDGRSLIAVPAALDGLDLLEAADRLGHPLCAEALIDVARFVTPPFSMVRFDTQHFLLPVEEIGPPRSTDGELVGFRVEPPAAILEDWRRFQTLLAPPTRMALEALVLGTEGMGARLRGGPGGQREEVYYIEAIDGIRVVPLLTPTLPPATHTNAYLVGTERCLIVDPATYDPAEREHLLVEIERHRRSGRPPWMVFLTHHHQDHVGSAQFLAEKLGLPIAAHPITQELLRGVVNVDVLVNDGDRLELGSPEAPFVVEAWHTPGHAPGHLILLDRRPGSGAMIVGDMLASVGTIIIDPSEGDMRAYLDQLARMKAAQPRVLFPAHGLAVVDAIGKIEQYIQHRLLREAKVRRALEAHPGAWNEAEALLPIAYDDTPVALYPLAARSCLAHLIKLAADGVALRDQERFQIAPAAG
ncbi:MAG: MBL fold metallo-hydrolase [Myxococcota bacterium]